ncbi:putative glycoside hydrolase-type carbohydrate-binding protein [Helianthus anomalus]
MLDFLDNLQRGKRFTEQPDAITFDGEVDIIYVVTYIYAYIFIYNWDYVFIKMVFFLIGDHKKKKTIVIRNEGLPYAAIL